MTPGATRRGRAFCASWRRADVATRALDCSSPGRRGVPDLDAGSPPGRSCQNGERVRHSLSPLELLYINRDRKIAVTVASDRRPWAPPRTPWERRLARADAALSAGRCSVWRGPMQRLAQADAALYAAQEERQEPRPCRRCVALKRVRLPLRYWKLSHSLWSGRAARSPAKPHALILPARPASSPNHQAIGRIAFWLPICFPGLG